VPKGEGVTQFEIYYGDGTVAGLPVNWEGKTSHKYKRR
jgi:hypothetical protein